MPRGRRERELTYVDAEVVDHDMGYSSNDTPQLCVVFAYVTPTGQRARISKYMPFSRAALPFTKRALEAMGWRAEEHDFDFSQLSGEGGALKGAPVRLALGESEYYQDGRLEVVFVNAPGGVALKERMSDREARQLGDGLRREWGDDDDRGGGRRDDDRRGGDRGREGHRDRIPF